MSFLTPPVSSGLLDGIGRRKLLVENKIKESVITKQDLSRAKSIWLVNSVRQSWQVNLRN